MLIEKANLQQGTVSDDPPPPDELEKDVKTVLMRVDKIQAVAHTLAHYIRGGVIVEANVIVDDRLTVREGIVCAGVMEDWGVLLNLLCEYLHVAFNHAMGCLVGFPG